MRLIAQLLAVALLVGCSAPAPMIDYDSSYDFSKDRTFAFLSEHPLIRAEGAVGGSSMLEGRLMQITENILSARGLTRISDPEKADLAVGFTLGARDKIQVNSFPQTYHSGYSRVYFCDPRSPWQRGSNENTNGLLRQYFPKGMDISMISQAKLNGVARRLNERPRKTLDYETPADRFSQCVASIG